MEEKLATLCPNYPFEHCIKIYNFSTLNFFHSLWLLSAASFRLCQHSWIRATTTTTIIIIIIIIIIYLLGHLLTRSGLTYPEVSSNVCHNSFCQCFITLGNLLQGLLFTCCIQFLLYSSYLSRIGVIFNSFVICVFVL